METLEHGIYYGFGHKSLSAKIIKNLLVPVGLIVVTAIILVTAGNSGSHELVTLGNWGIIIAVIIAVFQVIVAYLDYISAKFMISANALYIRTGILHRREISVPFRHINNIHQFQSITDRMLSIATCSIEVIDDEVMATGTEKFTGDIHLRDLDISLLSPLREAILSHANTQRMYMVSSSELNGSTVARDLEQKSRMYDQYLNQDSSKYPPFQG